MSRFCIRPFVTMALLNAMNILILLGGGGGGGGGEKVFNYCISQPQYWEVQNLCLSTKPGWLAQLNQPQNAQSYLTQKKLRWSTGSAIYQCLSSAISFRFSQPKKLLSQASCRADGRLYGLLSQSLTWTNLNLRRCLHGPQIHWRKFLTNKKISGMGNILLLWISCPESRLFAMQIP